MGPDPAGSGGMAAAMRSLLASPLSESYRLRVVVTHRTGSRRRRLAVFARSLRELSRLLGESPGPIVVHIHATVRGSLRRKAIVVAIARRRGALVVLQVHSGPGDLRTFHSRLGPVPRWLLRRAVASADRILAVSRASADELLRDWGARAVIIVDNPLPSSLPAIVEPSPAGADVLYLGGFANPVKGGEVLVDALPALHAACPQARVIFAGPGDPPDGASSPWIRWAGWLDDEAKARALAESAVVVIPSTSEGFPIALLEAMAHGKAIVATRVGAIPDVLHDGRAGVLVEPWAPAALGAAVGALVADPVRRRQLGAAARSRAEDFTPERVAVQIAAIYEELLRERSGDGVAGGSASSHR